MLYFHFHPVQCILNFLWDFLFGLVSKWLEIYPMSFWFLFLFLFQWDQRIHSVWFHFFKFMCFSVSRIWSYWHIFCGHFKRMYILLPLVECSVKSITVCWLVIVFYIPAAFLSNYSTICSEKGVEISNHNCGFVYFLFQIYQVFSSHI